MKINAYLNFDGSCRDAMTFYAEVLGGKLSSLLSFEEGGAGEHVPPEFKQAVMHACLEVGDQIIMASDAPPGMYEKAQGTSVCLHPDSIADTERIFAALATDGKQIMPLAETSWAERYGIVTDRFGTPWMLNFTGKYGA
ncbi:MAG: VOC family protein [Candidatus Melainabacteria bacterium HGW-Melainabacteria-1]|nr:MAG: VOC family protein [Candidatus Melainabacteria bacterium HGW-Melainabacteria-1]